MKTICYFLLFCMATTSMAYEIVTLVPGDSSRLRRQTKFSFDTQSNIAHLGNTGLFTNYNDQLYDIENISKEGINLDYTHTPSGSSFNTGAQNTKALGAVGSYDFVGKPTAQTYGGFMVMGKPTYAVDVDLQYTPKEPLSAGKYWGYTAENFGSTQTPSGSSLSAGAQYTKDFGVDSYNFVDKPTAQTYSDKQQDSFYGDFVPWLYGNTHKANYNVGVGLQYRL